MYPAPAVPRWYAEEGASISINRMHLTGYSGLHPLPLLAAPDAQRSALLSVSH
jgi:hypothetical protein